AGENPDEGKGEEVGRASQIDVAAGLALEGFVGWHQAHELAVVDLEHHVAIRRPLLADVHRPDSTMRVPCAGRPQGREQLRAGELRPHLRRLLYEQAPG